MENNSKDTLKFIETWNLVHNNLRMFNYWLKTYPFSPTEKRLLKAFYLYKKNKKEKSLELLQTKIQESSFYEGVRYYLIGLVYNQHGHFIYAIENLENSISLLRNVNYSNFIINPICLLINVYANRRDSKMADKLVQELESFKHLSDTQLLQKEYARMCYFSIARKTKDAENLFKKLETKQPDGFENYRPYFLVALFMLQSQDKDFKRCYSTLKEYSNYTGFVVKSNYLYMKTLLDHVVKDSPLYFYQKDFKDFPELRDQLEVVKALRNGDISEAKKFWAKLALHNPYLYAENFNYQGDQDLFYQSIEKYKNYLQVKEINLQDLKKCKTHLEKLNYIMKNTSAPVKIEELIQLIWNEEYTQSSLMRLRKLVSDYSKKYNIKIKPIQGAYTLI